jgi:4a-hydroxytetrahydrobiopterin dehydratase
MRTPPPLVPDETVDARLAANLPEWRRDGAAIEREFRTGGWATMLAAAAVAHLAEAAWLTDADPVLGPPRGPSRHPRSGGITERDLALAAESSGVTWRPGPPLEGTPDDPRFTHVMRRT